MMLRSSQKKAINGQPTTWAKRKAAAKVGLSVWHNEVRLPVQG